MTRVICIVSNSPLYNTCKEFLNDMMSIIINYKLNKALFPEQLKYVCLKDKVKSYTVLKEYYILEFYFAFVLNSIKQTKEENGYNILSVGNNIGRKIFMKYYQNSSGNGFPIPDYDMTLLLDRFNVEDLIKIYMCLLMEYKLILIFDDYSDINLLIFAIISLLYPLKWNFPIISFITPSLMETLEAPFALVIGVHSKYTQTVI
jgi:hypothetical protein